jgi:hypothetical protein
MGVTGECKFSGLVPDLCAEFLGWAQESVFNKSFGILMPTEVSLAREMI